MTEEKRRTRIQACPGATLPQQITGIGLGLNPDLRGERAGISQPCRVTSIVGRCRQLHVAIYRQNQRRLQIVELT